MFVYGISCSPADLMAIVGRSDGDIECDYYTDYSLLVFPQCTRPTVLNSYGNLTSQFWDRVRRVVQDAKRPHAVDLEDPWITEKQAEAARVIAEAYPSVKTQWYYVPNAITPDNSTLE
jgi:hypothetical protein